MQENTRYNITATFNSTIAPPPPPPPSTVLLRKPPKTTKSHTASFFWGAKRNGVFISPSSFKSQCKLDKQAAWQSCKSGKTYRGLAARSHTFRLRVGSGGRWDATPASWTWRIRG
jgi:hypothetical protein